MSADGSKGELCRLIYTSRLAERGRALGPGQARAKIIADDAGLRNVGDGITGVLLYLDGLFVQILEGTQDRVEATFERICRDMRHTDLQLIDMISVSERMFDDWAMASLGMDPHGRSENEELAEIAQLIEVNASEAAARMRDLLRRGKTASDNVARLKPMEPEAQATAR